MCGQGVAHASGYRHRGRGLQRLPTPCGSVLDLFVRHGTLDDPMEIGALVDEDPLDGPAVSSGEDCDGVIHLHHHGVVHRGK